MLRIASYNIHGCVGLDRRLDPDRIGDVIAELDADVVALQEVDSRGSSDAVDAQWQRLAERVGRLPVVGPTLIEHDGEYGNVLLSGVPVLEVRRHDLSVPGREPRGAVDVVLDVRGTELRVITTHLGLSARERRAQVGRLLSIIETEPELPLLLVGDFNEWLPFGRPLRWLRRELGRVPGPPTFPASLPWFALDRLWVRPAGMLKSVRSHRTRLSRVASDHLPLVATLDMCAP